MTLSVCVVNWNTCQDLRLALTALEKHPPTGAQMDVLVWDNASTDGSADMVSQEFPWVSLHQSDRNLGYAHANNQLIDKARAEFVLLMNPDVQIRESTLDVLLAKARADDRIAAVACRLLHPDGTIQPSVRRFPTASLVLWEALGLARLFPGSPLFGAYKMTWWDYADEREVDQPMASLLLLRRAALQEVGLFDEQFPLFFNDVDLCYRLKQAGWKILFTPEAQAIHRVGASTRQVRPESVAASHHSLILFFRKHYRQRYGPLTMALLEALIRVTGWLRVQWARLTAD